MQIKQLNNLTGGLSRTSKMPGYSYNLPASACKTGSKLRNKPGSICAKCYAHTGMYRFPNVKNAQAKRLNAIHAIGWTTNMIELIGKKCSKVPYFRWHDSGDLQSIPHLRKIIAAIFVLDIQCHILANYQTRQVVIIMLQLTVNVRITLSVRQPDHAKHVTVVELVGILK